MTATYNLLKVFLLETIVPHGQDETYNIDITIVFLRLPYASPIGSARKVTGDALYTY